MSVLLFCLVMGIFSLTAENLPFSGLSDAELAQMQRGEYLFRVLDSHEDSCFQSGDVWEHLKALLEDVDPNFLAEIVMVIPVDESRDNLQFIRSILLDVTSFDGIPYYSKRNEKWYPLFKNTEILSETSPTPGKDTIVAYHKMKPFDPEETVYNYSLDGDIFLFESVNNGNLYYKGFKAVKEGNMVTLLWVRDEGDRLIVYGAGGASAFTFFGLFGDRLTESFIGRVDAFFSWFYDNYISDIMIEG